MKRLFILVILMTSACGFISAHEDKWTTYLSGGISFPFFNNLIEYEGEKDSLDMNGFAFSLDAHVVYNPNGFSLLVKGGAGYMQSEIEGLDDTDGSGFYFMFGIGKKFGGERFSFIPALGIGFNYASLQTDYYYNRHYFDTVIEMTAVTLCTDLFASYMFTERFGISASLLLSLTAGGSGELELSYKSVSASEDFDINFGKVNCIPSISLCWKI